MMYVTDEQLSIIMNAVKNLPIHTQSFEEADSWVGLYLYLKEIEKQIIKGNNEEVSEDGRPSDQ